MDDPGRASPPPSTTMLRMRSLRSHSSWYLPEFLHSPATVYGDLKTQMAQGDRYVDGHEQEAEGRASRMRYGGRHIKMQMSFSKQQQQQQSRRLDPASLQRGSRALVMFAAPVCMCRHVFNMHDTAISKSAHAAI